MITEARQEVVRIELLGALRVRVDETEVVIHAPKERALLAVLALAPGNTLRTQDLIDGIWGEDPPLSARKAVQNYISALRRRLPIGVIETEPDGYRLDLRPDAIDVGVFERLVTESRLASTGGDHPRAVECLLDARRLWRGPPLAELSDHLGGVTQVTRLAEIYHASEEDLAEARLAIGEHQNLIPELEAAVLAEPLRERRWALLMLALYRSGRQAHALRAYQRLRKELGERLGIEPSPELVALEEAMVLQRPELAAPAAGLVGQKAELLEEPKTTPFLSLVPRPATALIGRDVELATAEKLLRDRRLVTLVGAGGAGKTRLAGEIAMSCASLMPDGVCWVGLQSVLASDLVMPAVAQALGAPGDVAAHVGSRRLLIVLDNFEQVVNAAPDVADLLSQTENLRVLVTSREPLRVAGEHLLPVGPLAQSDAEDLFVERAAAENPSFTPGPTLPPICRRLDGLPLAIELAAALISVFPMEELLRRLDRALPVLTGHRRDVPDRQRTLEATIQWSYDLLQPAHQRLLRTLSPLDSFDLGAVERLGGCSIESIHSLLDKNLIRRIGADRFQLPQAVREFALDRLPEHHEVESAHRTLVAYAVDALTRAEAGLHGPEQAAVLARLDVEYGNLRAAAQWAMSDETGTAARLAVGLGWYWMLRNHTGDGVSFLQRFVQMADRLGPVQRAPLLSAYGRLLFYRGEALGAAGDGEAACDILLQAEAAWQEVDRDGLPRRELIELVTTLVYLSITAGSIGNRALARRAAQQAIVVGEASGEPWCAGLAYWSLGTNVFLGRCDAHAADEVRETLERSVAYLRVAGDDWALGGPLLYLGRHLLMLGEIEGGFVAGTQALQAFRNAGDKWRTALALRHLANVAAAQGRRATSESMGDEADDLERELGTLAAQREG